MQKPSRIPGIKKQASPMKKILQQSDNAGGVRNARAMSNDPRDSYVNTSPKKLQYSQPLMSPGQPKKTDPRLSESHDAERFKTPSSASAIDLPRHHIQDA